MISEPLHDTSVEDAAKRLAGLEERNHDPNDLLEAQWLSDIHLPDCPFGLFTHYIEDCDPL